MNPFSYLLIAAGIAVGGYSGYFYGHHVGWNEGRANLVQQQTEKAAARLAKQTTRQQANDSKAAVADESGKAKTITITQEVIRYVKTPGRTVCTFDADRLSLKSAAVDNANSISGYDDAAVQTPASIR